MLVELNPLGPSTGHTVSHGFCQIHGTWLLRLKQKGTMPDDAKERLRKSLQSSLRQTLLRLVTMLETDVVPPF